MQGCILLQLLPILSAAYLFGSSCFQADDKLLANLYMHARKSEQNVDEHYTTLGVGSFNPKGIAHLLDEHYTTGVKHSLRPFSHNYRQDEDTETVYVACAAHLPAVHKLRRHVSAAGSPTVLP